MKNSIVYYTSVVLPVALLMYALSVGVLHGWSFLFAITLYALVYRTYIDYARLKSKKDSLNQSNWAFIKNKQQN